MFNWVNKLFQRDTASVHKVRFIKRRFSEHGVERLQPLPANWRWMWTAGQASSLNISSQPHAFPAVWEIISAARSLNLGDRLPWRAEAVKAAHVRTRFFCCNVQQTTLYFGHVHYDKSKHVITATARPLYYSSQHYILMPSSLFLFLLPKNHLSDKQQRQDFPWMFCWRRLTFSRWHCFLSCHSWQLSLLMKSIKDRHMRHHVFGTALDLEKLTLCLWQENSHTFG